MKSNSRVAKYFENGMAWYGMFPRNGTEFVFLTLFKCSKTVLF